MKKTNKGRGLPQEDFKMKTKLKCPFCGSQDVKESEFHKRTGIQLERTIKWDGELKVILKLGELAVQGHKMNAKDALDKERLLELLKQEHKRIDERHKEVEENRRNIAAEQKKTFEEIALQRKEVEDQKQQIISQTKGLNKLKEEVIKEESIQLPKEIMNKFKELQIVASASNTEIKELLQKMIHNVKTSGNLLEAQLTRRLKALNTGDKIEHLGGADKEDILITVKDGDKTLGSIKIDSKNVKKWDSKYIGQIKRYLKENKVDFGLIATTTMPKDAAGSDFYWEDDNILVVNQNIAESVYLVCRYLIIKNDEYASEYNNKAAMLQEDQQKLASIRTILNKVTFKKFLKTISEEVIKDNKNVNELETYFNRKVKAFRECNLKIMKQVNDALANDEELQKVLKSG